MYRLIFLDISKGFDSLNADVLIQKLSIHAVSDSGIYWFKSYLYGRNQIAKLNISSQSNTVLLGVPQGAVLGSILFLINLNLFSDLNLCHKQIYLAIVQSNLDKYFATESEISSMPPIRYCMCSHWYL